MTNKEDIEYVDGNARSGSAEASQLRETIDKGGAGDKVGFSDPAAAPLGTDDEAAGTPPSPDQVRMAQRLEGRRSEAEVEKQTPAERNSGISKWTAVAIAVAVLVVLVVTWMWIG